MTYTYIYINIHPANGACTFLSTINGAFTKVDHVLQHEGNLSTFESINKILVRCVCMSVILHINRLKGKKNYDYFSRWHCMTTVELN